MVHQASRCSLSSRAFYNDIFPRFAAYCTKIFGYEMVLPMNTGAEAVETALKLARKWGYQKKGVPENEAIIVAATGCFHGRTTTIISMSDDEEATHNFGPFTPGMMKVEYNNIEALKKLFEKHGKNIVGFLVEPVQGEAGVVIPSETYLKECYELCQKHNILLLSDEVQAGIGRTGKMLCSDHSGIKPDVIILGKAISGGLIPLSCVLSSREVMLNIQPGEHGSTYGGSPLASAVGIAALNVVVQEGLVENSAAMGSVMLAFLTDMKSQYSWIDDVRGKGLFCAVEIKKDFKMRAWDICMLLKEHGLLAKPTHENIIRFTPPLTINEAQLRQCTDIMKDVFAKVDAQ
mmetsp:Transcript_27780/g.30875  ORF Transcript_27780/g.30875 Transcript_27780/m.30875 type:complete len:347 (+) Transcript_27780:163-1203(+)